MVDYFNKNGLLLPNAVAWSRLEKDPSYRNVAVDIIQEEGVMISTIWRGYDDTGKTDPRNPAIFETAVVLDGRTMQAWRTYTLDEALKFHSEVCEKVLKRPAQPEDGWLQRVIEAETQLEAERNATVG